VTEQTKISTLQQRYGLNSKQAVYDRINGVGIIPAQKGFVSAEQLDLLDRLDKHIRLGGAIADFPKTPEVDPPTLERINQEEAPPQLDLPSVVYKLIEVIGTQKQTRSHLEQYRELEEIASHGWILPTSAIHEITHFKPRGTEVTRGCFHFLRIGKVGKQAAWRVSKVQVPVDTRKLDDQSHQPSLRQSDNAPQLDQTP
jgi:hypothetical protein